MEFFRICKNYEKITLFGIRDFDFLSAIMITNFKNLIHRVKSKITIKTT